MLVLLLLFRWPGAFLLLRRVPFPRLLLYVTQCIESGGGERGWREGREEREGEEREGERGEEDGFVVDQIFCFGFGRVVERVGE